MKNFILRVEGVDFDNTVFDTQNLSIIRGSSLALLNAPRAVEKFLNEKHHTNKPTKIFTGASQGAFIIEAENLPKAEDIAKAALDFLNNYSKNKPADGKALEPFSHLSFVVDVVEVKKDEKDIVALWRAHAKNRLSQMQAPRWPLPTFCKDAQGFSKNYDRLRPATEPWNDKKAQAIKTVREAQDDIKAYSLEDEPYSSGTEDKSSEKKKYGISKSGFDRFKYGRDGREGFYADFIAQYDEGKRQALRKAFKAKFTFCNDFEQIVADKPKDLPPSLENKIAVFYADGNKFSKIFNSQKFLDKYTKLSEDIVQRQQALLKSIMGWFVENTQNFEHGFALEHDVRVDGKKTGEKIPAFRFETLLWGGEELLFVMPAWLGLAFAQGFFECVKDWKVPEGVEHAGQPLTFSAGLVFCHHKTPIRQAKKVAEDLAKAGKDVLGDDITVQRNILSVEMFESISMPDADVGGYREKLYGITDDRSCEKKSEAIAETFKSLLTLEASTFDMALKLIAKMKDQFPRSQVYKFIRSAKEHQIFDVGDKIPTDEQLTDFNDAFNLYFQRAGANLNDDSETPRCMPVIHFQTEEGKEEKKPLNFLAESTLLADKSIEKCQSLAYSCAFIAQFWDYVNPTGQAVPPLTIDSSKSITTMGGAK